MRRLLTGIFIGLCLGGLVGFAGGILVFPYLFPPPPVNETIGDRSDADVLARGVFIHANPSDPIHYGSGSVAVYEDLLHLEADFNVGPGPKYHVYLVPEADVTPDTRVQDSMFVDLGRLKAFSGSQNYIVPQGIDLVQYGSVVIWCEQFNVLISPARLQASVR
jgi:hypothetical protein